jgi:hypothetical protein
MEEAKFSFNVKCIVKGFECCFTVREDQPGKGSELVDRSLQVVDYLVSKGATPVHVYAPKVAPAAVPPAIDWNHAPASGAPAAPAAAAVPSGVPVCKLCGSNTRVELVTFTKDGRQKSAYKCQACDKWLR